MLLVTTVLALVLNESQRFDHCKLTINSQDEQQLFQNFDVNPTSIFQCENGTIVPFDCFIDKNNTDGGNLVLKIDETVVFHNSIWKCVKFDENSTKLSLSGCLLDDGTFSDIADLSNSVECSQLSFTSQNETYSPNNSTLPNFNDTFLPANITTQFIDYCTLYNKSSIFRFDRDNDTVSILKCVNNNLELFGCQIPEKSLSIGEMTILDNFVLICDKMDNFTASLTKIACISQSGMILHANQTDIVGPEFFTCLQPENSTNLIYSRSGCVDFLNRTVKLFDLTEIDGIIYQCRENILDHLELYFHSCNPDSNLSSLSTMDKNSTVYQCSNCTVEIFGCRFDVSKIIAINETLIDNNFYFRCGLIDNATETVLRQIGCISQNQSIVYVNEPFQLGGEFFKCLTNKEHKLQYTKAGCVEFRSGQEIELGKSIVFNDISYTCLESLTTTKFNLEPSSCFKDAMIMTNIFFGIQDNSTVFQCRNGSIVIFGCKLPQNDINIILPPRNQSIIGLGDTVTFENYLLQCYQISSIQAKLYRLGCISHTGTLLAPGQTEKDGQEFYQCVGKFHNQPDEPSLEYEKVGCIDPLGQEILAGNFTDLKPNQNTGKIHTVRYQCYWDSLVGKFQLKPHGCVQNATLYMPGQAMVIGQYWFTCSRS